MKNNKYDLNFINHLNFMFSLFWEVSVQLEAKYTTTRKALELSVKVNFDPLKTVCSLLHILCDTDQPTDLQVLRQLIENLANCQVMVP